MTTKYAVLNVERDIFIKRGRHGGHLYSNRKNAVVDANESHLEVVEVTV